MEIRLSPISSIDDTELLLSVFELYAFTRGEALFSDLDIDFDTILQDIEADPAKYDLEEERELLRDEPVAAQQLIEELAMDAVFQLVDDREEKLGRNYAFERVEGEPTTLRTKQQDQINASAFATAWLSFFTAIDADGFLNMPKKEKRALRMLYARVFELVALLAATSIGPAVGWWTGRSWAEVAKFENFERLCSVVGSGKVKSVEDWEEVQNQANDAGVDGFLVTTVGGKISNASICIALGATVQKKQRRNKKVGKDAQDRLLDFYVNRPTIALIGAAADPYPPEPSLAQDYSKANCLYLHGEALWMLLSIYAPTTLVGPLAEMLEAIEDALKTEMRTALNGSVITIGGVQFALGDAFDASLNNNFIYSALTLKAVQNL